MDLSNFLYDPSLDLFLYHIKDGLGESEDKIKENHDKFWENLPPKLKVDFGTESKAENSGYIKLFKLTQEKPTFPLQAKPIRGYKIGGYYYPVLFSDTYGLLLDCDFDDKNSVFSVDCFQEFKNIFADKKGDLGKIWMISGYRDSSSTPEDIAKAAYKSLMGKEWQPGNVKFGNFMGADIFEISQLSPSDYWKCIDDSPEDKSPVLIIIYPTADTMDKARYFYDYWLNLLCHRQKILWAYRDSRKYSKELQKQLSLINSTIKIINQSKLDLSTLKTNIAIFSNYVIQLEQLEILNQAIKVNLHNYQSWLNHITTRASQLGETKLNFLEEFSDVVTKQYQKQIEEDYNIFKPGLSVLESLRDTISQIIEIDQAESDRQFQQNVEVVGFGLATAAIAATAISPFVPNIIKTEPNENLPAVEGGINFLATTLFSILVGILAKWAAEVWVRSRIVSQAKSHRQPPNK